MVALVDLAGGFSSIAKAVSADGSVIVGGSGSNRIEAFRWTQAEGMLGLGFLAEDDYYTDATGVSADGSVIVGESFSVNGTVAFRWTQAGGMVSLKDTLIGAGLDLSDWNLTYTTGVSADGFTIVGYGTNPSGQTEGWVANLSPEPVPEPLTILGSMAAIAFATRFERSFSKDKSQEKDPDA